MEGSTLAAAVAVEGPLLAYGCDIVLGVWYGLVETFLDVVRAVESFAFEVIDSLAFASASFFAFKRSRAIRLFSAISSAVHSITMVLLCAQFISLVLNSTFLFCLCFL